MIAMQQQTNLASPRTVARYLRAMGLAKNSPDGARAFAAGQGWGINDEVLVGLEIDRYVERAAVPAHVLASVANGPAGIAFLGVQRPRSVVGRLSQLKKAPLRTRITVAGGGASAGVLAEGQAIPLGKLNLSAPVSLEPHRIAGLAVVTEELLARSAPDSDDLIVGDLADAVAQAEDVAFLNASFGIATGVTTITSGGSTVAQVDADLQTALQQLVTAGSDLQAAAWIMGPRTAGYLAGLRNSGGGRAYEGMSALGGELLGLPVVVSKSAAGAIFLVDQQQTVVGTAGPFLETSNAASLEMNDAPASNVTTPTGASQVSMFQSDSVALKATIWLGSYARPGSVAIIGSVAY